MEEMAGATLKSSNPAWDARVCKSACEPSRSDSVMVAVGFSPRLVTGKTRVASRRLKLAVKFRRRYATHLATELSVG